MKPNNTLFNGRKLSFLGRFSDPKYEGMMSISLRLRDLLEKQGIPIQFNNLLANILHVHSSGFLPSLDRRLKAHRKRVIYSLYGNINESPFQIIGDYIDKIYFKSYESVPWLIKNFLFTFTSTIIPLKLKAHFLKKMGLVILPNQFLKDKLKIPNSKVIKYGTNIEKFRNLNLKNKDKLVVSFFGHNAPLKGLKDVIKSFSKIKDPDIILNAYISRFPSKKLAQKIKNNNINLYGYVDDIVKEYNKSDIIVLPYRSYSSTIAIPLVLIESMACERAIITTNVPTIKEITKDSAILIDPYSPDQIVQAINKLKNNPGLRKELGKKAREIVIEEYNEEKTSQAYLELYSSFLDKISLASSKSEG